MVALLGASGSGKSTLLRVVAGLIAPDNGHVVLDGRDITSVPTHRRAIGMVFQDEQLFPHRDVAANVEFGLRMAGSAGGGPTARVAELLGIVGLAGFEHRRVTDLSGGEAKRVALARSLAPAPRVLLLDEPLTGLDRQLHDRLAGELAEILRATGTTSLIVTHDPAEAATVADRVVRMDELGRVEIVDLTSGETHPLRAAILRTGTPSHDVVWAGDERADTTHLGARADGRLVAISTWMPTGDEIQLRGMAVDAGQQGRGIGTALLTAGIERAAARGATAVWANARDSALDFYVRHGFEIVGDGFVTGDTGLPHHKIRLVPLPPPRDTQAVLRRRRRMDPASEELRRRAVELRRVAAQIEAVGIDELIGWAGPTRGAARRRMPAGRCWSATANACSTRPTSYATPPGASSGRPTPPTPWPRCASSHETRRAPGQARSRRPNNHARRSGGGAAQGGGRQPGHPHRATGVPAHLHDPRARGGRTRRASPPARTPMSRSTRCTSTSRRRNAGRSRMASSWPDGSRLWPSQRRDAGPRLLQPPDRPPDVVDLLGGRAAATGVDLGRAPGGAARDSGRRPRLALAASIARTMLSALRARWASTCPTVHPGNRLGPAGSSRAPARASSSSPSRRWWAAAAPATSRSS